VPVENTSIGDMTKNLRSAGYKGGSKWKSGPMGSTYKSFRNADTDVSISIDRWPSGTGGGQVYGYDVLGVVGDSYWDAVAARGEEVPSFAR